MKYSITSKKKKWLVKNAVAICECLHEIKQKTYNIVDHPSKICVTKMPAVILQYKKCHSDKQPSI
jgi:hypothetical protein